MKAKTNTTSTGFRDVIKNRGGEKMHALTRHSDSFSLSLRVPQLQDCYIILELI